MYPIFPSLDEASIDDLLGYLEDGSVTSVDLVHVSFLLPVEGQKVSVSGVHKENVRGKSPTSCGARDESRCSGYCTNTGCRTGCGTCTRVRQGASEMAPGAKFLHRPLHGIPILIKDNIATMDKMNNTGTTADCFLLSTRADISSRLSRTARRYC